MSLTRIALVALAALGGLGFSSAFSFDLTAERGGGGGYPFTGSATAHGRSCAVCHQPPAGVAPAQVDVFSPDGPVLREYEPSRLYTLEVRLLHEQRGLNRRSGCATGAGECNRNVFVAEALDAAGRPAGTLCHTGMAAGDPECPSESDFGVTVIASGAGVAGQSLSFPVQCTAPGTPEDCVDFAAMSARGASDAEVAAAVAARISARTRWSFSWRAPPAGTGPVDLHVGLVDGDGGQSFDPMYADFQGDAVFVGHWRSAERGVALPRSNDTSGCQSAPGTPMPRRWGLPIVLMLPLLLLLARQRT